MLGGVSLRGRAVLDLTEQSRKRPQDGAMYFSGKLRLQLVNVIRNSLQYECGQTSHRHFYKFVNDAFSNSTLNCHYFLFKLRKKCAEFLRTSPAITRKDLHKLLQQFR